MFRIDVEMIFSRNLVWIFGFVVILVSAEMSSAQTAGVIEFECKVLRDHNGEGLFGKKLRLKYDEARATVFLRDEIVEEMGRNWLIISDPQVSAKKISFSYSLAVPTTRVGRSIQGSTSRKYSYRFAYFRQTRKFNHSVQIYNHHGKAAGVCTEK